MANHYPHGKTALCILRVKQVSTGFVRVRRKLLTPDQIKSYQERVNVPEGDFVLASIELE